MDLLEAYNDFVFSRDAFCSDETVRNYKNTIRYFCEFLSGYMGKEVDEILVNDIKLLHLNEYSIFLKTKVKNEGHEYIPYDGSLISSRTRKSYLTDMKTFIGYLITENHITTNILERFRMPRATGRLVEPLTIKEVEKIDGVLAKNKNFGIRDIAIIHLLLDEGLRSSEVRNLRLHDVNFEKRCILIRNSKFNKNRVLPMAGICFDTLKNYIEYKRPEVVHDYVFCMNDDTPLSKESMKCLFSRLKKTTSISRIHPHLLRHTFGTSFVLGGGSLEILKHYMGHSDIKTTENYLHIANNFQFCTDIYRLDEVFKKKFY